MIKTEKVTHEDGRIWRLPSRQMKNIIKMLEMLEKVNQKCV